jgi:pimeloyl-ACP methyl ester carboxylesterase
MQWSTKHHCESEAAMTIHAAVPTANRNADPSNGSGRLTGVVLGSLTIGAVSALVLTMLVFAGAIEAVVTGSLLLAFGLGWGALAFMSARTSHLQRWALVPAVAMGVTGVGLMALSPQNAALAVLNWVWPPLMLGLVAWMYVQARRALPGRTWWLLTPVFAILALAAGGAGMQDMSSGDLLQDYPMPGQRYSVGDHQLHVHCRGAGEPTVVLFNGMGEFSGSWARITDPVSATARVCAYDRAGQAWSDEVDHPQDGIGAVADLHALLAAAGEHGPYVLVGHSIGGPYALTFAAQYPKDVVGMVLLDSSSPRQFAEMPAYPTQYALMKRGLALLPTLARIGLGPVITSASHLPGLDGDLIDEVSSTVRAKRNGRDELSTIPALFKQAQALNTLGDRPLVVLTASGNLGTEGWAAAQARLAALSSDSVHRTVQASHTGMVEDPQGSDASVAAITAVIRSVASGSSVATS